MSTFAGPEILVDTLEYPALKNRLQSTNCSNNIFLYVDAKNTKYVLTYMSGTHIECNSKNPLCVMIRNEKYL